MQCEPRLSGLRCYPIRCLVDCWVEFGFGDQAEFFGLLLDGQPVEVAALPWAIVHSPYDELRACRQPLDLGAELQDLVGSPLCKPSNIRARHRIFAIRSRPDPQPLDEIAHPRGSSLEVSGCERRRSRKFSSRRRALSIRSRAISPSSTEQRQRAAGAAP